MVRNFYIKGTIDGRKTELSGGSSRKDGGMRLVITQREEGSIVECVTINCYERAGVLTTSITDKQGNVVFENVTKR